MAETESQFGGRRPASRFGGTFVEDQPLLEDTRTVGPVIQEDPVDASGIGTAMLSGMTNDETNKVFWLATKRFPEIYEQGGDPSVYYAFDENGDLYYRDPYTGEYKKEFADDPFGYDIDYLDNIGPAGQFLAEVIPGTIGMGKGFVIGGYPGAMAGGSLGTAAGGGVAYGVRAGISEALGGPPLAVDQAVKDLTLSTVFGGVPFGVPTREAPIGIKQIMEKFPGSDGRSILADIVQNGGKTVDDKLAYMAEKYPDIPISRAEASGLVGSAGYKAEVFLSKNARTQELVDHYNDRNARVGYHAERFFDAVLQGKYVRGDAKNKLTGKPAVDAEMDVAQAAADYIQAEKDKLAEITRPMYREAYDLDVSIDVSDILKEIDSVIANPNTSPARLSAYQDMRLALTDRRFEDENIARSTTELLHDGLKDNFNRLISKLTRDADSPLKREVSIIRDKISRRMKAENPLYEQVTKIYDDAIGTAQTLDRSIVGLFAKAVEQGGTKAASLTKKLFTGAIKPDEVIELKRVLQSTEEGAQAWQNLKGTWLSTQFDDVVASQTNPLSEPSAYLRAIGIKNPERAFPRQPTQLDKFGQPLPQSADDLAKIGGELAEYRAKGARAKLWQAILEPDELRNFIDLTSMMQMVGRIQTQAGSDTFGNFSMNAVFSNEAKQILGKGQTAGDVAKQTGRAAGGLMSAIMSFPSRLTARGFEDVVSGTVNAQKEAYRDLLISHIVDPRKAAELAATLEVTKPLAYLTGQTFMRGGTEGVTELFTSIENRNQALREASEERLEERVQEEQLPEPTATPTEPDLSAMIDAVQVPSLDVDLFEDEEAPSFGPAFDPAMSPTILPRDDDRELAMRMRTRQSGIGSLV